MSRTGRVYLLIGLFAAGCGGELDDMSNGPGIDPNAAPKAMFETAVQPIMMQTCNVCHTGNAAGPPFMAPMPDVYSTVKAWPGLVGSSPQASKVYMKGMHEGPGFTPMQAMIVAQWINAEAMANRGGNPDGGGSTIIAPFIPQPGSNTIDLGTLGPGLAGATLKFDASISGAGLSMASLSITAPATTGIHVVHPLFTVYPQSGPAAPDPVDSFSGLDQTINMGATHMIGPGTLILTSFHLGDKIGVVFQTLAATNPPGGTDGGTGGGGGCKDVTDFTADAKPPLSNTCVTCHGGNNAGAQSALDMSRVNDTSADGQAAACAQVLNRVTPATPAQSRIFQVTAPGSTAVHPFKFPDQTTFNAFQNMVSQWIVREQ
jgi:hypothetical protein